MVSPDVSRSQARLKDALGRTAKQIATTEKHALGASILATHENEEAREGVLAKQEQMIQELRQMAPVRENLEVTPAQLEALGTALATFGSEQTIFSAAQQLQSAASLLTQSLLPARRLGDQLATLDTEASSLEQQLEQQRGYLAHVSCPLIAACPSDGPLIAPPDRPSDRPSDRPPDRSLRASASPRRRPISRPTSRPTSPPNPRAGPIQAARRALGRGPRRRARRHARSLPGGLGRLAAQVLLPIASDCF